MEVGLIQFNKDFGRFRARQIEKAEITKHSYRIKTWYIPKQYAIILCREQQKQKPKDLTTIKSIFRFIRTHHRFI